MFATPAILRVSQSLTFGDLEVALSDDVAAVFRDLEAWQQQLRVRNVELQAELNRVRLAGIAIGLMMAG